MTARRPARPMTTRRPSTPSVSDSVVVGADGIARNLKGLQVCGRQKTRGRGPCESTVLYPNGCCKKHGGPSLSGAAAPAFKHGRFSKHLPSALRQHYEDNRRDPDVLVLMDELAVLDARLAQLLGTLDAGETGAKWAAARDIFSRIKAAQSAKDIGGMVNGLNALEAVINAGSADADVWRDVLTVIGLKRKVADTETKRLVRKHRVLTEDRAYELLRHVLHILRERIPDRKLLGLIGADLERVLGGTSTLTVVPA